MAIKTMLLSAVATAALLTPPLASLLAQQDTSHPAPPRRSTNAHTDLAGTYVVREHVIFAPTGKPPSSTRRSGVAVITDAGDGLISLWNEQESADLASVSWIGSALAAQDGRAALSFAGGDFDGYQTDDGFYVTGMSAGGDHPAHSAFTLTRSAIPLTAATGLYDARVTARFVEDRTGMGPRELTPFLGSMAVLVVRDSVFVALSLKNLNGGGAGLQGVGQVRSGSFYARADNGSSLSGTLGGGRFVADWVQELDNQRGYSWRGSVSGTRR